MPMLVQLLSTDDLSAPSWRMPLSPAQPISLGDACIDGSSGAWLLCGDARIDGRSLIDGEPARLHDGALIEAGACWYLFRDVAATPAGEEVPSLSPSWEAALQLLDRLARSQHAVLIEGESGAGKEVIARALHERSGRPGPLISVNCAALPENLLEDELFGHVRGAFSGAVSNRDGLFRAAHGGTLFLDEVGDMPASLQARMLRVLEDRKVRPLGGETEFSVDVRVISATHRDLRMLAQTGAFRHDLLARLGLLPLHIPPLRDRREDLGRLIRTLLAAVPGGLSSIRISPDAALALLRHRWPLNVRELRSALLSAADLARDDDGISRIDLIHLPSAVRARPRPVSFAPCSPADAALRTRLIGLLSEHRGNVAAVARALGNPRTNVQRMMARLGVSRLPKPDGPGGFSGA